MRFLLLKAALAPLLFSACKQPPTILAAGNLGMSSDSLEFGELAPSGTQNVSVTLTNTGEVALTIMSISLASAADDRQGQPGAFAVWWDPDAVTARSASTAAADTGGGGTIDTATVDTGGGTGSAVDLAPGASLPVSVSFTPMTVGDNYDALVVRSSDPDDAVRIATLHGTGLASSPNVLVQPRTVQFGYLWQGQSASRLITIKNAGTGDLTVKSVELDSDCSDGFSISDAPAPGTAISGGFSSVIALLFTPPDDSEARCSLTVRTTDEDAPDQLVELTANSGSNPKNRSPIAVIHAPGPGYVHQGWGPVRMELTVTDPDQPPQTLTCKVRSALQLSASLANCVPTDPNGHLWVDVPIEDALDAGLDVFVVQVTDGFGITRKASLPLMIDAPFPAGDDDGDGFEPNAVDNPDCDDSDPASYPFAAELFDGRDNDCDSRTDEGTDGADDDGDGMSEVGGDCDDTEPGTYAGAPEQLDGADNDCNGTVDDGTSAYDDDGDGFSELDLDCDDADPATNPSAAEICGDGRDNNCNGLKDTAEPCAANDSVPMIVGGIRLAKTAIEARDTVAFSVLVHEADGDRVADQWSVEGGAGTLDSSGGSTVFWTAPSSLGDGVDVRSYQLSYIGADDDGNQSWAFSDITVYAKGKLPSSVTSEPAARGCSTGSSEPALWPLAAALFALRPRGARWPRPRRSRPEE